MSKFTKTICGALCLTLTTLGYSGYASTAAMQFSAAISALEPTGDQVYSARANTVWPMSFSGINAPVHMVLAGTHQLVETYAGVSGPTHAMQFFKGTVSPPEHPIREVDLGRG